MNASDDDDLLDLLYRAGLNSVFVGIETTEPEALKKMKKLQNTKRDIASGLRKFYAHGIKVTPSLILGNDGETDAVANELLSLVERTPIAAFCFSLLRAQGNTQLSRRLEAEGRLFKETTETGEVFPGAPRGLNFITERPRERIEADFLRILTVAYAPWNYFPRIARLIPQLKNDSRPPGPPAGARGSRSAFPLRRLAGKVPKLFRLLCALGREPSGLLAFLVTLVWIAILRPSGWQVFLDYTISYLEQRGFRRQALQATRAQRQFTSPARFDLLSAWASRGK
jgi:hypothetical protein